MPYEGLLFRTTDALKWGTGKGSRLSSLEVDQNFYEVITRIVSLEDNPPVPVNISNIQVIGSQLTIFLDDGSSYGPFTLPVAQFRFRSDWLPAVQYYELDLVSVAGKGLYMVRLDHISDSVFDENATDGDGHALYLKVFGEDTYIYTFGFFYPGSPGNGMTSGDPVFAHLFNTPVVLPGDAADSYARLRVDPAADMEFALYKNTDPIGTLTFTAGSNEGVIDFASTDIGFEAGDVFYALYPTDGLDADARDLTVTIKGLRGELSS